LVKTKKARLDGSGRLTVDYDTGAKERNFRVTLEADVTDASRRFASGSAGVRVTLADYSADIELDRAFVLAGEAVGFRFRAEGFDGVPVAGGTFTARLKREGDAGPPLERVFETGGNGEAKLTLEAGDAGRTVLTVSGRDAAGRLVRTSKSFWVVKPGVALAHGQKKLALLPDRRSYRPGETARVLALVPWKNPHLLATLEASAILSHEIRTTEGDALLLTVPVTEAHAPNVFLHAAAVHAGRVHRAECTLVVPPRSRFLAISASPSKKAFAPGEFGEIAVAVTDMDGNPVRAEISVAVVDEALYALRSEQNPPIEKFFYSLRRNGVRRSDSARFLSFREAVRDPNRIPAFVVSAGTAKALAEALEKIGELPAGESSRPVPALAAYQTRTGRLHLLFGERIRFDKHALSVRKKILTDLLAKAKGGEADRLKAALDVLTRLEPLAPEPKRGRGGAGKKEEKEDRGPAFEDDDGGGGEGGGEGEEGGEDAEPEEERRARGGEGTPAPPPAATPAPRPDAGAGFLGGVRKKKLEDGASAPEERKDFASSVLWVPHLTTDENGRAVAPLQFKDDLTTWRIRVFAVDGETRVGSGRGSVLTRRLAVVRLGAPRFLRARDRAEIPVIGHNLSKKKSGSVLEVAAEGLPLKGKTKAETDVEAGGSVDVTVLATPTAGASASLSASFRTAEGADAVRVKLPVLPHGVERFKTKAGLLASGETEFRFELPEGFDPYTAEAQVHVASGFAEAVASGTKYLVEYPHGCTEQTLNRLLPNLVAQETFQALNLAPPVPKEEFLKAMKKGLARLGALQHPSGGWGWWKADPDDPFMTALAVYGLARGKALGLPVNPKVLAAGVKRATQYASAPKLDFPKRAWMLLALTEAGTDVKVHADRLFDTTQRAEADPYTRALLLIVFSRLPDRREEASAIAEELLGGAKEGEGGLWWGEAGAPRWTADPVEVTAWAATALQIFEAKHPAVEKALDWLMGQRKGGRWKSTRDTAAAVLAMARYLAGHGAARGELTVALTINGEDLVGTGPTKVPSLGKVFGAGGGSLVAGENRIVVRHAAGPPAFYSILVTWFSEEENVPPAEAGLLVTRTYHRLEAVEKEGKQVFVATEIPTTEAVESGALVLVVVDVSSKEDREYVMVTDPLPASAQVEERDSSFEIPTRPKGPKATREVHDEAVVFFLARLQSGETARFSYLFRTTVRGTFHTMPAQAELMYFPHVRGISGERVFQVK
ncbi:MAG: alpha-2-macroglobulin family protein, partial [Planctomycetota bacterium]